MTKLAYEVYAIDLMGSLYPDYSTEVTSEKSAIQQAENYVKQYPKLSVYIKFYRKSDGQIGYLNPDGFAINGKDWSSDN